MHKNEYGYFFIGRRTMVVIVVVILAITALASYLAVTEQLARLFG